MRPFHIYNNFFGRWVEKFSAGDTNMENQPWGRPPSEINDYAENHYQTGSGLAAQFCCAARSLPAYRQFLDT